MAYLSMSRRASSSSSRSTCASPIRRTERGLSGACSWSQSRGSRFSLIEDPFEQWTPSLRATSERRRRALRRPARRYARDLALRLAPRTCRPQRGARLGRRRLRLQEGQGAHRERPRRPGRDLTRYRRVLRGRRPAPGLRHAPGASGAEHDLRISRSRAHSVTRRPPSGAG